VHAVRYRAAHTFRPGSISYWRSHPGATVSEVEPQGISAERRLFAAGIRCAQPSGRGPSLNERPTAVAINWKTLASQQEMNLTGGLGVFAPASTPLSSHILPKALFVHQRPRWVVDNRDTPIATQTRSTK
jgi:hypothetical protein